MPRSFVGSLLLLLLVAPLGALPHFDEISVMGEAQRDEESYRLGIEFLESGVRKIYAGSQSVGARGG